MLRFLSADLWKELKRSSAKRGHMLGAVAYLSNAHALHFKKGDVLIVDASKTSVASGGTSAKALHALWKKGVALYSYPGLHAKVVVVKDVAYVGSMNMSLRSRENLIEAAVGSDLPTVVSACRSFIDGLRRGGIRLDGNRIKRLLAVKVERSGWIGQRKGRTRRQSKLGHRTWIVACHELDEGAFPNEVLRAKKGYVKATKDTDLRESEVAWLRWQRKGRFARQARSGDSILLVNKNKKGSKIFEVDYHRAILHRQKEPTCVRFYYEIQTPGRVSVSGGEFLRLLKISGYSRALGKWVAAEIPEPVSTSLAQHWSRKK